MRCPASRCCQSAKLGWRKRNKKVVLHFTEPLMGCKPKTAEAPVCEKSLGCLKEVEMEWNLLCPQCSPERLLPSGKVSAFPPQKFPERSAPEQNCQLLSRAECLAALHHLGPRGEVSLSPGLWQTQLNVSTV